MRRKLQIFTLYFSFFFVFNSLGFSQRYEFMDHGISFFIPGKFSCKTTKIDEDINFFCEYKEENISVVLSKKQDPWLIKSLYKLEEDDYEKADQIIETIESVINGIKIKDYIIDRIFNKNMILCDVYMKVKTLDIKFYRYSFVALGVTNKLSALFIAISAKPNTDKKIAIDNYKKLKKKYLKEIISGIVFY